MNLYSSANKPGLGLVSLWRCLRISKPKIEILPMLIGNLLYVGDKRLVGFYVEIRNKPGVLADIALVFKKYNVNIWNIVFSSRVEVGSIGSGFILADLTDSSIKPEEVKEELGKLDNVEYVEVAKPQHLKLLVDPYHFPIVDDSGARHVVFSERAMESIVYGVREKFGQGGLAFLYHQGLLAGEYTLKKIVELGVKDLREALKIMLLHAMSHGRYLGEIIDYSYGHPLREDRVILRLYNNWECETAKRLGVRGPASHYERGVIAGVVQTYTGREVRVRETACIASGDRYCEFYIEFI